MEKYKIINGEEVTSKKTIKDAIEEAKMLIKSGKYEKLIIVYDEKTITVNDKQVIFE